MLQGVVRAWYVQASPISFLSLFLCLHTWNKVYLPPEVITEDFMWEVCPVWALVLGAAGR